MDLLWHSNGHVVKKALQVIQNMMGLLQKDKASPMAVLLVKKVDSFLNSVRLLWEPVP